MATSIKEEKAQGANQSPKKSSNMLVVLLVLIALGGIAAAAATYFLKRDSKPEEVVVVPEIPIFVALDPFTVNLQPNGRSRFLHVGVALKVADMKAQGQVSQYLPEVRSRVLTVLSNRVPEALITAEDKAKLSAEIMTALNLPFAPKQPPIKISSVMFTTFMLQ